jgi:hypothetical protein
VSEKIRATAQRENRPLTKTAARIGDRIHRLRDKGDFDFIKVTAVLYLRAWFKSSVSLAVSMRRSRPKTEHRNRYPVHQ